MADPNDSVFSDDWGEDHRSGVVAVIGRPNVGKSTLVNAILGQKIAITTPKPQTTRRNQLGIYTTQAGQILFVDTPGLHRAQNKLGEYMMQTAEFALRDADVVLWILDASQPPQKADTIIAGTLSEKASHKPIILVLNKIDAVQDRETLAAHRGLIAHHSAVETSAVNGDGVAQLTQQLMRMMPHGPRYFPVDQVSDLNMRFIAAEVVREKTILNTEHEVPHSVGVQVTGYREEADITRIEATIYVERTSQKGIIIGKGGSMIKVIGTQARAELEAMLETQVFLDLHVKVQKNWRSDEGFMRRLGYRIPKEDDA